MLTKQITYEDFNGNTVTETFYFNLSQTDLVNMDAEVDGGFQARLERISKENRATLLIVEMEQIVKRAYGVRSDDGKRFVKDDAATLEFTQTAAYDALITELSTDADKSAAFMIGLLPKNLAAQLDKVVEDSKTQLPPPPPPA